VFPEAESTDDVAVRDGRIVGASRMATRAMSIS
jgi:hypothetical protein